MEGTPRLAGGAPDDATVLGHALQRFVDLTRALVAHHARYGVHGALRPQAFVGDPPTVDHAPGPAGADVSLGVLRYASPEVAGRIAEPDTRSDLYSIGAIGFELLAGAPPFTATERAALAYDQVATPAPALTAGGVPAQLAAIVAVLLRKSPAERYTSAQSLLADLERCLADWLATGTIAAFTPDAHGPPRFAPTGELYGRAAHLAELDRALDRAIDGPAVVVMLIGPAGSGKSALLHALRSAAVARQARFLLGRFDRAVGARPYAGLRELGEALMRQLLTRPDAEMEAFRRSVLESLGERVAILAELVPGIVKLTGTPAALGEVGPGGAAHWFHAAVADFAQLVATRDTPLVGALDDLQWADQASLDVVAAVAERHTAGGLLLVGTYRPDELGATTPLRDTLSRLRLDANRLIEVELGPLSIDDVSALADDACGGALVDPRGLAEVVCAKSGGNPLHVHQLLRDLVADGDLAPAADGWRWHPRVRTRSVTDNVVDLTARRIGALPAATQRALAATALAGRTFTLAVAAAATAAPPDDVLRALAPALHDGVLETVGHADEQTFVFAHERLRQVALELETDRPGAQIHLAIARHLHADQASIARAAHLFATVDHYAAAVDVIEPHERGAVAGLAMMAGGLAYSTLAHAAADAYFTLARRMLRWDTDRAAKWRASAAAALALSIRNRHEEFAAIIDEMRSHAPGVFERVRTASIEAVHLTRARQLSASMRVASVGLVECGLDVPFGDADAVERATAAHLATFRAAVAGRDLVEVLSALPRLDDGDVSVPLDLIAAASDAAAMGDTCFANLLAAAGAVYCLEHGNSRRAALVYTLLAQCLIDRDQAYGDAAALIEVARRLDAGQLHDPWMTGRMASTRAAFVDHWLRPADAVLDAIPAQVAAGTSVHDPMYAAYQLAVAPVLQAVLGRSLGAVLADHQRVVEHCRSHSIEFISALSAPAAAYAEALMGRTESITSLDGSALRVEAFLGDDARELPIARYQLHSFEIALHGLVGNYADVLDRATDVAFTQVPPHATALPVAQWVGTAAARRAAGAAGPARQQLLDELAARTEFVRSALERGEEANSAHRLAILTAEAALVEGHPARAFELFGEAAELARRHGWLIDEGYARAQQAQLAARVGRPDYAVQLLYADAEGCWRTAGALALVRWIRPLAEVVRAERTAAADPTPGLLVSLDTEVVVQAVQLLTVDAGTDGLCARLLGLAIDASGAERGAVVGMADGDLRVVAASPNLAGVPTDLIRLTLRTGRAQHVRPRTADSEFSADDEAALGGRRPAAMLCVPVGWAGEPSRVLYLEHAELDRVFTGARRNVVGWLAGHTGIVLGHAELYSALEHEVMARTRELTEAKEAAERATAAKSEFLAHMSHEVRTPMNAVLGLAEILQATELDDFQREQLARLDRAGRLLMGILSDVLDFSRIEAGELDLAEIPFDLGEVVRDVVGVVSSDAAGRGVALVTDVADDVPRRLVGDPVRLGQVLLNLLANAIKFTLHGSVELHIGLAPGTPSSGEPTVTELRWLRAEVRDTGRGIAAADLERIFEPFQQVHRPSFHPNRSGSGLGLPISRHVARRMGGDLTVTSRVGAGSVFTLEWPARVDRRATPAPVAPDRRSTAAPHDVSGRRILVVEDNDINREILRHMLAPLGVHVSEAANGAEAVALAARDAFDLVLMDCQMPVLDGYEATRVLRAGGVGIPIVGVSAHVSVDDRQRAIDAGMNDYLTKPIDVKLLQGTVVSWLAG